MTRPGSSSCDDDRVNRARRGGLSAHEREDLEGHLGACADCRIAWRLAHDFDGSAGARPGDERMLARAAGVALAGSRRKFLVTRVAASAAAVIVLLVGVASAAVLLDIGRDRWTRDRAAAAPAAAGLTSRLHRSWLRVGAAPIAAASDPPAPEPALAPEQPMAVASHPVAVPRTDPSPAASRSALPRRHASAAMPGAASSAHLFAQAVEARRQGDAKRAIALFRELLQTYPATSEAHVTLVSLGDLLMGRGDPAGALSAFDEYLRLDPAGALFPEALDGRARALTALGRRHDADEAWRELDARLPASPYARARGALHEGARP